MNSFLIKVFALFANPTRTLARIVAKEEYQNEAGYEAADMCHVGNAGVRGFHDRSKALKELEDGPESDDNEGRQISYLTEETKRYENADSLMRIKDEIS